MKYKTFKTGFYFVGIQLAVFFFSDSALATQTPWVGTYTSKNPAKDSPFIVTKLVLSVGKNHDYVATMEVNRLLGDDIKKPVSMEGYADVYSSYDDKTRTDRMFIRFPKTKYSPFLEVYPGSKSSRVENAGGFNTISYTYFENCQWHSYTAGELVRKRAKLK